MKQVYRNGILLDGTKDMSPVCGKLVFVKDGVIEKIEEEGSCCEGYEIVDLEGMYLMPGLINMHVHLPANGKPKKKASDPKKAVKLIMSNNLMKWIGKQICGSYAKTELFSGVTTIRTVGGVGNFDTAIRDEIEAGKRVGPRILASDMAVSVEDGHMAGSLAYTALSKEDMVKYVDEIAKNHPDLIKLMITGGVLDAKKEGEPGVLKMPAEFVKAGCDRAHELGFKVAAHVESPEGVRVALENGVDTIEHGAKPDEEILSLFKKKNAALITTLSPALPFAMFDPSISHVDHMQQVNGRIVFEGIVECAKACLANGIPVGLGTDTGCPYTTHYNMWRELCFFHKYVGATNKETLYAATLQNAIIAGIEHSTGSIEVGKSADFLAVRNNPLEDLSALRDPALVVFKGQMHKNPSVKKMEEVEAQLDQFI